MSNVKKKKKPNAIQLPKEYWPELNRLGKDWFYAPPDCRKNFQSQLIQLIYEDLLDRIPAIANPTLWEENTRFFVVDFIIDRRIEKYNYEKNPKFSAYVNKCLEYWQKCHSFYEETEPYELLGRHTKTIQKGEPTGKFDDSDRPILADEKMRVTVFGFDTVNLEDTRNTSTDGETTTWSQCISNRDHEKFMEEKDCEVTLMEILRIITLMRDTPGKKHPDDSLFFTDRFVNWLKEDDQNSLSFRHEAECLKALDHMFMDYFLLTHCSTMKEIFLTPLKPYGELVEGKGDQPCKQPLPRDVYQAYLAKYYNYPVSLQAISNMYKKFQKLVLLLNSTE